jgi:hypothetical protein
MKPLRGGFLKLQADPYLPHRQLRFTAAEPFSKGPGVEAPFSRTATTPARERALHSPLAGEGGDLSDRQGIPSVLSSFVPIPRYSSR